tara:strand:+ start:183 stop:446 length:264 start_codon:yes stop_codon:yes gene_type:complete
VAGIELWMAFVCVMGDARLIMMMILMSDDGARAIPCKGCDDTVWMMMMLFEVGRWASKEPLENGLFELRKAMKERSCPTSCPESCPP